MARKESADEAVKDPNPTIDGRRANVNLAYLGAKNRTNTVPSMFNNFVWTNICLIIYLFFVVNYGLITRVPTYPSTATAYPYVYNYS